MSGKQWQVVPLMFVVKFADGAAHPEVPVDQAKLLQCKSCKSRRALYRQVLLMEEGLPEQVGPAFATGAPGMERNSVETPDPEAFPTPS